MRTKANHQLELDFHPSNLQLTNEYYENMETIEQLGKEIGVVSIAKKAKRTEEEAIGESDPGFRFAQRFRAGVEGSISYLKRILGLFRCFNKGWEPFACTVGATIFTHNVLVLARQ